MIGLGYFAKMPIGLLGNLNKIGMAYLIVPVLLTGVVYIILAILTIWLLSWLVGVDREEIKSLFRKGLAST